MITDRLKLKKLGLHIITDDCSGLNVYKNCHLLDFLYFSIQIVNDLEENFAKIHLPDRQFYLP